MESCISFSLWKCTSWWPPDDLHLISFVDQFNYSYGWVLFFPTILWHGHLTLAYETVRLVLNGLYRGFLRLVDCCSRRFNYNMTMVDVEKLFSFTPYFTHFSLLCSSTPYIFWTGIYSRFSLTTDYFSVGCTLTYLYQWRRLL